MANCKKFFLCNKTVKIKKTDEKIAPHFENYPPNAFLPRKKGGNKKLLFFFFIIQCQ